MTIKKTESQEQRDLFLWARLQEGSFPELKLMYHIPNEGKRSKYTGHRMKMEGLRPGVPDICLPVPCGEWHGLYLELKSMSGKVSSQQKEWIAELNKQGYQAYIAYGFEEASNLISTYLKKKRSLERKEVNYAGKRATQQN